MTRTAMTMTRAGSALAVLLIAGQVSYGQTASPGPGPRASAPPPCASPQHRQFDFWVGDWNVKNPKGALAGTNLITKEYGGCVIQEHWVGKGGLTGSSFNIYTPATGRWHQTWVDSSGTLLLLDGEFKDGKMRLAGESPSADGSKVLHRLSFEPRADGTVRQFWESSSDGGKTWSVVFDGLYERRTGN